MNRIRWAEGMWALLVLIAAATMACGLADAFSFIFAPPTYPVGHRLVDAAALAALPDGALVVNAGRWLTLTYSPRKYCPAGSSARSTSSIRNRSRRTTRCGPPPTH
jgi:hypothetical protein